MPPRSGNQHILDILPKFTVLRQIDLNSDLAALFIGDELDSVHASIVLHMQLV